MTRASLTQVTDAVTVVSTPSEKCPICLGVRRERFQARILNKHHIRYFYCESCGLLQTENPYWLDEAYSSAIADSDTGLISRNLTIAVRLANLVYFYFDPQARYLDFAGGYGLLTRLMRDRGFDFYWHDPYCQNVFARGFEWERESGKAAGAVTAFEVLEHVLDPLAFVRNALEQAKTSNIIFSTLLYQDEPPPPDQWWYYALETGQHISFFRRETLEALGNKLGLRLYSNGWFHVFTQKNIARMGFRFCSSRLAPVIDSYVKRRMNSRTFSDHSFIVERNDNHTDAGRKS